MSTEATMHTFHTPHPVRLRVELGLGRLSVEAVETDTTTVELRPLSSTAQDQIDNARVEQRGEEILVQLPRAKGRLFRARGDVEAVIQVPLHSSATLESESADIKTRGQLGGVNVNNGSGDVTVESATDATIKTGSGDIVVDTITGSCDITSGSADVRLGSVGRSADVLAGSGDVVIDSVAGALKVKTGSGDVVVESAGDSVDAKAGSGDLLFRRIDHGRVEVKTGSGDISIGVAEGTAAYLDIVTVTGEVKSDLDASEAPGGDDLTAEISIQSGTGDVVLQRA